MTTESERKKFQPRMVASFSKPQIESVAAWLSREVHNSTANGSTFDSVLETVGLDEKGKVMDEKSRRRITYGLATINILQKEGVRINQIAGIIQVWQITPDEDTIEIRVDPIHARSMGLRKY